MERIFLTGAKGFVGQNLAKTLNKNNCLLAIDDEYFLDDNWEIGLKKLLNDHSPTIIFHVGACSNTLENDVNYMMIRNYESTKIISDWCAQNESKLVYSSSAANYGENGRFPSTLYGWSKYAGEDYVLKNGGVGLRYFNVYGPGEEKKGKMASLAHQSYIKHSNGEKVLLFPKKPARDFVYIKDVVSANLYAWNTYDTNKGKYYEVGTGIANPFEKVLDFLGISYGYTPTTAIPKGYQYYTCSNKKKWIPGWQPTHSLKRGIQEYKEILKNKELK